MHPQLVQQRCVRQCAVTPEPVVCQLQHSSRDRGGVSTLGGRRLRLDPHGVHVDPHDLVRPLALQRRDHLASCSEASSAPKSCSLIDSTGGSTASGRHGVASACFQSSSPSIHASSRAAPASSHSPASTLQTRPPVKLPLPMTPRRDGSVEEVDLRVVGPTPEVENPHVHPQATRLGQSRARRVASKDPCGEQPSVPPHLLQLPSDKVQTRHADEGDAPQQVARGRSTRAQSRQQRVPMPRSDEGGHPGSMPRHGDGRRTVMSPMERTDVRPDPNS